MAVGMIRKAVLNDMADTMILILYIIFLFILAIRTLAKYLLFGIGLYTMARRAGIGSEWMAFVPFLRKYLQGKLAGPVTLKGKTLKEPGVWLAILPFAVGLLCGFLFALLMAVVVAGSLINSSAFIMIPVSGVVILAGILVALLLLVGAVAQNGLRALVDYQILSRYCQGNILVLHIVFCVVFPLYEALIFFCYRHKD